MAAPVLSLRAISFRRGHRAILSGVSLDLSEGEIFCILGPSGSGKTTLLKIIAGLLAPSAGIIEILGKVQSGIPPHKRNLGFVFQDPAALLPHLTVFENVAFPLRVRGAIREEEIRRNVNSILDSVHLADKAGRLPEDLSGGERQRVALARAFVYQPALLLLDEPLNSLDNITKEDLLRYIAGLRERFETTCLYITHDEREALRLADRIGMLIEGRLLQVGTPKEVFESPVSATIAKITSEWNLLTVDLDLERGLVLPEGSTPSKLSSGYEVPTASSFLTLGFPISETTVLRDVASIDEVAMPATVESTFISDNRLYALAVIGRQPVKVALPLDEVVPVPGSKLTIGVKVSKLRPFPAQEV